VAQTKRIRDNVHGYITIDRDVLALIVDTPLFQRLRLIEQTSMRVLYPSARHDRFIHSLGVYHLGREASKHFVKNVEKHANECYGAIEPEEWTRFQYLFQFACLLHDCGHAPFSHTLEFFYGITPSVIPEYPEWFSAITPEFLDTKLKGLCSESFVNDYEMSADLNGNVGAPHERMSALLVITEYRETILKLLQNRITSYREDMLSDDIEFIARMIIGLQYPIIRDADEPSRVENDKRQIRNCFIELLNGNLDVDKLDYIVRDAIVSGIDAIQVDISRYLSSLSIATIMDCENAVLDHHEIDSKCIFPSESTRDGEEGDDELDWAILKAIDDSPASFEGEFECDYRIVTYAGKKPYPISDIEHHKSSSDGNPQPLRGGEFRIRFSALHGKMTGCFTGKILGHQPSLWNLDNNANGVARRFVVAYHKSALSVLESIVAGRNYEHQWIYQDHTVTYHATFLVPEALRTCVRVLRRDNALVDFLHQLGARESEIGTYLAKEHLGQIPETQRIGSDDIIRELLGWQSLVSNDILCRASCTTGRHLCYAGFPFIAVTDEDLRTFFKWTRNRIEGSAITCTRYTHGDGTTDSADRCRYLLEAFFSRNYCTPVWKSFAEYKMLPTYEKARRVMDILTVDTVTREVFREYDNTSEYGVVTPKRVPELQEIYDELKLKHIVWAKPSASHKIFPDELYVVMKKKSEDRDAALTPYSSVNQLTGGKVDGVESFYFLYCRFDDRRERNDDGSLVRLSDLQMEQLFDVIIEHAETFSGTVTEEV